MKTIITNMEKVRSDYQTPLRRSKPHYASSLTPSTLSTFTGLSVDPRHLRIDSINITDIAHSLSLLCRFGGHCKEFYSVAQHSVEVSKQVSDEFALTALLHDASEAYVCDLPRALKNLFPEYKKLEEEIQEKISVRFGLYWPFPAEIKTADNIEVLTEAKSLLERPMYDLELAPREEKLKSQAPAFAERSFLDRYTELTND